MHIFGRVTNATTGAPVKGARIVLEVGGRAVAVNSSEEGRFTWRDDSLSRGRTLEYRAAKSGFEPRSGSDEVGGDEVELAIELRPRTMIVRILVRDSERRPLTGADVRLERESEVLDEATSGEDGIAGLAIPVDALDAALRYRVSLQGYQATEGVPEEVESDRSEPMEVVLSPAARVDPDNRLEAVRRHPDYSSLIGDHPSSAGLYLSNIAGVLVGLMFSGFGVVWVSMVSGGPGPEGLIAVGFLFMALGAAIAIYGLVRLIRLASQRVRTSPALILAKRTKIRGGGSNSSARTSYFLTLELEDVDRRELRTRGRVYGLVAEGDAGVAFTRGSFLLDFRRVNV